METAAIVAGAAHLRGAQTRSPPEGEPYAPDSQKSKSPAKAGPLQASGKAAEPYISIPSMPPIPPMPWAWPPALFFSSTNSATIASVVSKSPATDAAF